MSNSNRNHAIVLGGSIAGLFTARILSGHFKHVTIIERDPVNNYPESRKGQAHTRHTHAVLAPANQFIHKYMPQVHQSLLDNGARSADAGENITWYQYGGYRKKTATGLKTMVVSRPFLEYHVRCGVLQIPNVSLIDNTKAGELLLNDAKTQVTGIKLLHRGSEESTSTLYADLIVDACGRGTPAPKWLEQVGYDVPEKEQVKIGVSYTSRIYKRHGEDIERPGAYLIVGTAPKDKTAAVMVPVEDNQWYMTIGGYHGHHVPSDEAGFMEAVRNLPTNDIYNVVSRSEPVSEIMTFKYPASRRFRYDRLNRFPDGLLALGDSVVSFNPIYGQGMSSAALQIEVLDNLLQEKELSGLWRIFFSKQRRVIDNVWSIAVSEDFRYPETEGKKPFGIDLMNRYWELVKRAAQTDELVSKQMTYVIHLLESPASLMQPRILWRVLCATFRRTHSHEQVRRFCCIESSRRKKAHEERCIERL